jgi:hypothetical protein
MRGTVLGYEANNAAGAIRGEDGARYSFVRNEWKSAFKPAPGALVDFIASGADAREIYPVGSAAALRLNEFGSTMAERIRRFVFRLPFAFAAMVFLGCLLPILRAPPEAGIVGADADSSLLGLQSNYFSVIVALARVQSNLAVELAFTLSYVLLAIPLLAGWVLVAEFRNRGGTGASRPLQIVAGGVALALPILYLWLGPLLLSASGDVTLQGIGRALRNWNIGALLIVGGGLLLVLSGLGALSRQSQPEFGAEIAPLPQLPQAPSPSQEKPAPAPSQANFAVDAERRDDFVRHEPDFAPPPEPERRSRLPAAAWAAIAIVIVGALAGGGYFGWTRWQAQQAAQALDARWAAVSRTDAAALREFIASSPSAHVQEAQEALKQLEQERLTQAQAADTPEAFTQFIADFPGSEHTEVVQKRLSELEAQRVVIAAVSGAWNGALDTGGNAPVELKLTLSAVEQSLRGSFELVNVCGGALDAGVGSVERASPWVFSVSMAAGQCDARLQITVAQPYAGALNVSFFDPGRSEVIAQGVLQRADAGPATPTP